MDRVLSYIVDLRRISPLFFIPLEPYPARFARHLPHAGKAVLSLCHPPQSALPLRGQAKEAQEASCASLIGMHFPAEIRCIHCLMSFRIAAEGKTALPEVFLFADIAFDRPAIEESTDIEE